MILYVDTSTLVKRYVEESGSEDAVRWMSDADLVVTCRVAFPEGLSGLARRNREGAFAAADFAAVLARFEADWDRLGIVDFDERAAGNLVLRHPLRGFAAIHLSAAMAILGTAKDRVAFSSFDSRLNQAARSEGLEVLGA